MSDLLATLPGLVAEQIKSGPLPGLRECKAIAGRFNVDRLKETGVRTPAVLISMLGVKPADGMGGPLPLFTAEMAAFVVTRDVQEPERLERDVAAARITGVLMGYIPNKVWGSADCGEAFDVRGQSLVSRDNTRFDTSLWAVTWSQPIALNSLPGGAPLAIELYVGEAPEIGTDHLSDYTRIGGEP